GSDSSGIRQSERTVLCPDSSTYVAHFYSGVGGAFAALFRVRVPAFGPDRAQRRGDLVIAGGAAQQGAQVVPLAGEQAQIQLPLGRQAGAVAVATEGLADAGDDADLAAAVGIAPALGHLAG